MFHYFVHFVHLHRLYYIQIERMLIVLQRSRKGQHFSELQFGICMLDDVFEFGARVPQWTSALFAEGGAGLPLHRLRDGLAHREPEVRQSAAFGIGLLAATASALQTPALVQFVLGPYLPYTVCTRNVLLCNVQYFFV